MSGHLVGIVCGRVASRNASNSLDVVFHVVAGSAQNLPVRGLIFAALAGRVNMIQLELERVALAADRAAVVVFCKHRLELISSCLAHVGKCQVPNVVAVFHG